MKYKNIYGIIIPLTFFSIISFASIYSASILMNSSTNLLTKQITWYIISIIIIIIMQKINTKYINIPLLFYIFGNIMLLLLLFFGKEINGSKCWFIIPGFGSVQPSEFMKLFLILMNAKIISKCRNNSLFNDIKLFIAIMIITLIPSILTFLEPDTGMVIIYFFISFIMLFIYGLKKSIFIVIISLALCMILLFFYFFNYYQDTFINIFGTSLFYRIDRLTSWQTQSGIQLTNALSVIKASGLFGFGIGNIPLYFPEPQTDFIFSVCIGSFGFIGAVILLILFFWFDISLLLLAKKNNNKYYKFIIIGYLAMILYQQIQNTYMNIGLLPITGITLPFISYGGSSLLSYMIGIGLILLIENKSNS